MTGRKKLDRCHEPEKETVNFKLLLKQIAEIVFEPQGESFTLHKVFLIKKVIPVKTVGTVREYLHILDTIPPVLHTRGLTIIRQTKSVTLILFQITVKVHPSV